MSEVAQRQREAFERLRARVEKAQARSAQLLSRVSETVSVAGAVRASAAFTREGSRASRARRSPVTIVVPAVVLAQASSIPTRARPRSERVRRVPKRSSAATARSDPDPAPERPALAGTPASGSSS